MFRSLGLVTVASVSSVLFAPPAMLGQKSSEEKERPRLMVLSGGSKSFLGVGVAEVNPDRAKALNLKEERGVEVTRVEEDSPAAKAGLKVQDVVLEYQGQRVEGTEQFVRLVRETPAGREVKMQIARGGQVMPVSATIASRKLKAIETGDMQISIPRLEELPSVRLPDVPRAVVNWRNPMLGVEAEALNPQLAEFFGVKEGVLVRSVTKGSAADKSGIKAGDVITKVDDKAVASPLEVTRAIRGSAEKGNFPVVLTREKREMTVSVRIEAENETGRPRGRVVRLPDNQFE